ncbi:MAG: aminopeptidase [Lachnospiraceae bacterium]|nr:aminopeptidase [Lachnospiraceae bacterium]
MEKEILKERLELAMQRIALIREEAYREKNFEEYFHKMAQYLMLIEDNRQFLEQGGLTGASAEELAERNAAMYEDILPENYGKCFANPVYAVEKLGKDFGQLLAFLAVEIYNLPVFCYQGKLEDLVIRLELFVEIYGVFEAEMAEEQGLPDQEKIRQVLYWFVSDYSDLFIMNDVGQMTKPGESAVCRILREADLTDERYLYTYGEYISGNEREIYRFLQSLPQETIDLMADTYTEGYRIGFELAGKDLKKKKIAEILYPLGFERMMKKAAANLKEMGLDVVQRDHSNSFFYFKPLPFGTEPNRQLLFDHRNDMGLFLDKALVERKLEVLQTVFEKYKAEARGYAGPAVVEIFGENEFNPVNHPEAVQLTDAQNELLLDYKSRAFGIQSKYILQEERSFTIIAFPTPEIRSALPDDSSETYRKFFEEIIRINTLDYHLYSKIQTRIIDVLNTADYCEIKGMNGNRTDLKVNLYKLSDPEKETIFENCVADVNIPVGEVFTSPVLKGTEGLLHVSRVFLNGLEFRNLSIRFEDGMIAEYDCSNFETEKENREFIKENVLFRFKSLPIGEFAIGTNTTAYVVARKYGVESRFPILIAEKTGPHFAVGDTCYSRSEEVKVYNPDGKEIVARDNEISLLRKTDISKAYFNCHTDITIPYDELGELAAVTKEGVRIPIIQNGKFVLPGTEELNKPLEES